jgi:hypothetical protein
MSRLPPDVLRERETKYQAALVKAHKITPCTSRTKINTIVVASVSIPARTTD